MKIKALSLLLATFVVIVFVASVLLNPVTSSASTSSGTIDSTDRYAWSENTGWIDFGTTLGAVTITDSALTGYAYSENTGWISLNCSNTSSCTDNSYKIANNNEGTLSGYAWNENAGWINFAPTLGGVTISSSGVFSGYAYSENLGWINFTTDHPVTTDWRPLSSRTVAATPTPTVSNSSGGSRSLSPQVLATLLTPTLVPGCPPNMTCTPIPGFVPPTQPLTINHQPFTITPTTFTRNLTIGWKGTDVKTLQQYLNFKGYTLATTGPGSPGNETNFFGPLTRLALARFQKEHNISPPAGYFGPITRGYIQNNQ